MQRVWSTYLQQDQARSASAASGRPSMDSPSHSRRASSVISHANSTASAAASTRHMLAPMGSQLEPPNAPFTSSNNSLRSNSPRNDSPLLSDSHSLSVNYLPSKFSDAVLYNGLKRRNRNGQTVGVPKRGGGREAFRSGEARMPNEADEDYDGVQSGWFGKDGKGPKSRLRWNRFKWVLFFSNFLFSGYSLAGLIFLLLTWFNVWHHADIVRVGNRPELILSTLAASMGIFTSLIGWSGILLNNRSFLAVYTFLLWICFALLVIPGYVTYKKHTFNLDAKTSAQWSDDLGIPDWLRIQNQLHCCGFFSPFVEAAVSQTCYSRSVLPGCKGPYMDFERRTLKRWYIIVFGLVPFQIAVIVCGLMCSNHITYRFGKGMMPKAYRLSMNSMAVIMDQYANQLAEQYGADVASEAIARSRSNLQLDSLPTMPYSTGSSSTVGSKYDSLTNRG